MRIERFISRRSSGCLHAWRRPPPST
jgi:hypothetical protein